jgi:UDPglucose 6-dehydrogenase
MSIKVGQVGYGFVGEALYRSFKSRGVTPIVYDKYLDTWETEVEDLLSCDVIFFCLPTPFVAGHGFDLGALLENAKRLRNAGYTGIVSIKSTVEPGITQSIANKFPEMMFCHNPEFLSSTTSFEDFDNQRHIVLGYTDHRRWNQGLESVIDSKVGSLYRELYPNAEISLCTSEESESMKIFANNFYAMKVQIFNEFRFLCQKTGADYDKVKDMMIKNGWINQMHTDVPGRDGLPSYGGLCFPKDTNALKHFMKTKGSPHKVLEACIEERNRMRKD